MAPTQESVVTPPPLKRAGEAAPGPSPKRVKTGSTKRRKSQEPVALTPEEEAAAAAVAEELLATVDRSWKDMLHSILASPDGQRVLTKYLKACSKVARVFPPRNLVLNAFSVTKFDEVKVVILGQDPYHREGQAMGLAFSVPAGVPLPPSLKKIYEELGIKHHTEGDLSAWCDQGVLLLNPVLTVEEGKAGSHQNLGWHLLTDAVLERLSQTHPNSLVFMLWGNRAQAKAKLIDAEKHLVLTAAHPSPLATKGGFLGCRHFELANQHLTEKGLTPIDWKAIVPEQPIEEEQEQEPTNKVDEVEQEPTAARVEEEEAQTKDQPSEVLSERQPAESEPRHQDNLSERPEDHQQGDQQGDHLSQGHITSQDHHISQDHITSQDHISQSLQDELGDCRDSFIERQEIFSERQETISERQEYSVPPSAPNEVPLEVQSEPCGGAPTERAGCPCRVDTGDAMTDHAPTLITDPALQREKLSDLSDRTEGEV